MGIEKIKLKFEESKDTKEIIGFVSRSSTTWRLRGVSEKDDCPKKICLLAPDLKGLIKPNVVYEVELRPMRKGHGFIVISATRPKYDAKIETIIIPKSVYQVRIIFGQRRHSENEMTCKTPKRLSRNFTEQRTCCFSKWNRTAISSDDEPPHRRDRHRCVPLYEIR